MLIFYLFAILTVAPAFVAVFHPNILYAALSLFISFFGVAGLYLLLAADFVAATQVLLYVGGILILLLFAVMLSPKIYSPTFQESQKRYIVPSILGVFILSIIVFSIFKTNWNVTLVEGIFPHTVSRIGNLFLTDYLLPFELASILLLAALIGAILLARSSEDEHQ
ncbi:MAG: hypothetical protein A3B70_08585 [Deltaproteobacteria bacterium RIFCSPHIGHO2_02_FULL_40_11]|nr:MAG: hypothetical protein A3B70_08585 [Deltaproteobacteria bacterium RIFCSPHIGHO2_02_FULL_40_11]